MKKAFTLSELLVAIAIVGILSAILIPIINMATPNKNAILAKKAYYSTVTAVSNLINNPNCYPDKTMMRCNNKQWKDFCSVDSAGVPHNSKCIGAEKELKARMECAETVGRREGLDDEYGYENCYWGRDTAQSMVSIANPGSYSTSRYLYSGTKFVTLFAKELGGEKKSGSGGGLSYIVTTADGIEYDVHNALHGFVEITVDVDGFGKGADTNTGTSPDQFSMLVYKNGQIRIQRTSDDDWGSEIIKITSKITN